jgi:phosphatidylserine synthase
MISFWIYLTLLLLLLIFVWGFYLVAKIHTYKFKEYSTHIQPVTRFVGAFLLILTVIGFYYVFKELGNTESTPKTVADVAQIEQY